MKQSILFGIFAFLLVSISISSCSKEDQEDDNNNNTLNKTPSCEITNPLKYSKVVQGGTATIMVEALDFDGQIIDVQFFVNDILLGSDNTVPYIYFWKTEGIEIGEHMFCAVSTDDKNAQNSDTVFIEVIPSGIAPEADFLITNSQGPAPLTVAFLDRSLNTPTSWYWIFGDGNTSREQNPTHTYQQDGVYGVTLKVSNDYGNDTIYKHNCIYVGNGGGGQIPLTFIPVTGGTFQMGSNEGLADEKPVHQVYLNDFSISKYETTNSQFCDFLNDIGCSGSGYYIDGTLYINMAGEKCGIVYVIDEFISKNGKDDFPVEDVSWYGAMAFARWAGGRLPTEAEWEYAAAGGSLSQQTAFSGSNIIEDVAWYEINSSEESHYVGMKQTNELGLFDMSGNVWEWCADFYDAEYYSISPENNPQGPDYGLKCVLRGGSYLSNEAGCRISNRFSYSPDKSSWSIGFRVVKD